MTTPHKCAEILRAIADGKPVQFRLTNTVCKEWEDLDTNASFSIFQGLAVEYRIKPKPLIKKWRWVVVEPSKTLSITNSHYSDPKDWEQKFGLGYKLLQKIDSTMIEVEQDD